MKTPRGYCGYCPSDLTTEFRGAKKHNISFENTSIQMNTLKLGLGDSVTFTDYFNGFDEEDVSVSLETPSIASVSGTTITAKNVGESALNFEKKIQNEEEPESPVSVMLIVADSNTAVLGDVNDDGTFSTADLILLKKWLMHKSGAYLPQWKNADFNQDGKINIYDFCLMKKELLNLK